MTERLDTSQGWCRDGRTYAEHAHTDGHCCQSQGTRLEDLAPEAQEAAEQRLPPHLG